MLRLGGMRVRVTLFGRRQLDQHDCLEYETASLGFGDSSVHAGVTIKSLLVHWAGIFVIDPSTGKVDTVPIHCVISLWFSNDLSIVRENECARTVFDNTAGACIE